MQLAAQVGAALAVRGRKGGHQFVEVAVHITDDVQGAGARGGLRGRYGRRVDCHLKRVTTVDHGQIALRGCVALRMVHRRLYGSDGLVGVRGNYAFTPQFYAVGWGLVGAGGADVDWDVMAGVGYNINETFSATFGYRALGVDYSDDGFLFDVVQQGPIAGLTIRF